MEAIVELANKFGFKRHSSKLDLPVVFHCVPGSGKSTAIRELIQADSRFVAYTAGRADTPGLSGAWIKKFEGLVSSDKFVILDEYTLLEELPQGLFAVFGDPVQSDTRLCLRAHFTCNFSRRFGKATATLLQELGFDVLAEGDDVVQILDIFSVDPLDTIVYFEEEVGCLLRAHCVEALHVGDIQGATFEEVTFATSENSPRIDRVSAFQCLTRHRRALRILCPGATYKAA